MTLNNNLNWLEKRSLALRIRPNKSWVLCNISNFERHFLYVCCARLGMSYDEIIKLFLKISPCGLGRKYESVLLKTEIMLFQDSL